MSEFSYEGTDILENLTEAVNYNCSLTNLVIRFSKKGRALDFGAGIGTFSDLVKEDLDPVCLEIDPPQASFLEKKGYRVIQDLGNEKFDYIYSLNVFEHIEDDKSAAEKLVQGLNPGGKVFIFVPAFSFLFSSLDEKVGHFRRYTKRQLINLFKNEEVYITKASYFDSVGFLFALIFKLFGLKTDNINKKNIIIFDRLFFPFSRFFDYLFSSFFGKNVYVVIEKK